VTCTEKGRRGEEFFDCVVRESPRINTWFVEDTSSVTGRGDRLCSDGKGFNLMVELKNVENRLHRCDIDKFTRDAKACLEDGYCDAAMLISLRTKSIPERGAVHLEYIHQKPVLWLCSDSPATITAALVMLRGVAVKAKRENLKVPGLALQDRMVVTKLVQNAVNCLLTNQERADTLQVNIDASSKLVSAIRDEMQQAIVEQKNLIAALTFGEEIESSFFAEALEWFTGFFEQNNKHTTKHHKTIPPKILAFLKRGDNSCEEMREHVAKRLRLADSEID